MKRWIALLLAAMILMGMTAAVADAWKCEICGYTGNTGNKCRFCASPPGATEEPAAPTATPAPAVKVGDIITVGRMEQDHNEKNGTEEIEWIVLAVDGSKALVISRYGLTTRTFSKNARQQTWQNSDIRAWLNDEFLYTCFEHHEIEAIQLTHVDESASQGNPAMRSARTGTDTEDKLFLLSYAEAKQYLPSETKRMCVPTAYTVARKCNRSSRQLLNGEKTSWYWLRSTAYKNNVIVVSQNGGFDSMDLNEGHGVVRPAMWVDTALISK